jgi:hypothetical protein
MASSAKVSMNFGTEALRAFPVVRHGVELILTTRSNGVVVRES